MSMHLDDLLSPRKDTHTVLKTVFLGRFSFERYISSPHINFTGTATFEKKTDNPIIYTEQGQYQLQEIEQSCYQKRIFIIEESALSIYKSDLSPLHEFALDKMPVLPFRLTHTHLCLNDQYSLEMVIDSLNRFSTSYKVRGPSKNYEIHTTFTREG